MNRTRRPQGNTARHRSPDGAGEVHGAPGERFTGPARLEWWANDSLRVDAYAIDVDTSGVWQVSGRHTPALDTTRRGAWDLLMELDPCFTAVLPGEDGGTILMHVTEAPDGALTLTPAQAQDGPAADTERG